MRPASDKTENQVTVIGRAIAQLHSELIRATREALAAHAVRLHYSQVQVLRRLGAGGPSTAAELTRSFACDSGGMTRLIDQLERHHLVRRHPDPADRRVLTIALTPAGEQLSRQLIALSNQVLDQALGDLHADERAQLIQFLGRALSTLRNARK